MWSRTIAAIGLSLGVVISANAPARAAPTGAEVSTKVANPAMTKAVVDFRKRFTDAGGALFNEDILGAKSALRDAGTHLANIRVLSRLDVIRRLVAQIAGPTAVSPATAGNLDKLSAELDRLVDKDQAAAAKDYLEKAREALAKKEASAVRENAWAVLDSLIEPRAGIPLTTWVAALTRADALLGSSRSAADKISEATAVLGAAQPEAALRGAAFRDQLKKIDALVAQSVSYFDKGYNRDGTAVLDRAEPFIAAAIRVAPGEEAKSAASALSGKFRRCLDNLNNRTLVGGIGAGGRIQTLTGFRELQETRSYIDDLMKRYGPKFD